MQHALSILADGVAGPLSEEQKKFVTLSTRNLQRLNNLINDLLDLSKLEAKKMELRFETLAIGSVIDGVYESMEAWANSKAITLGKRLEDGLPSVTCDPARITQVLTNLVGNAVKFTPKQGRVIIDAKLTVDSKAIEVGVADNGVGISKEDLAKLFNKFQQVGERSASDIGGTGLGLAISKEIVELHRGRIWAESDPVKRGARFVFTLPLEPPPKAEGAS
ncbi:MAG: HAMP domain-containing histidine kinase, partial [Candidatus Omnitrophica bacterium]|nr:HAMP domain-containing histidine kinase [Candidatus Omnitrophota bacterium]